MSPSIIVCALGFWAASVADNPPAQISAKVVSVPVVFRVRVPDSTPKNAKVYLAGSLPVLGEWKPDGMKMKRLDDGRYAVTLLLPVGATLEYKLNLGSWQAVEKDAK